MLEALKLKNDKYASLAAYYHLLYYYKPLRTGQCSQMDSQDGTACTKKSGLWDYFFDARRFQIDLYTFTEQYELAISEANKMKQKALDIDNNRGMVAAYQCLSNAYIGSQRWDERTQSAGRSPGCFKEWQCGSPYLRLVTGSYPLPKK